MTKDMIDRIVNMEWEMFDAVHNVGGRADCQDDPSTFNIMRRSQFEAWNAETIESYLDDLLEARARGINLMECKYGYMMEYNAPEEFAEIRHRLPEIPDEKKRLIRALADSQLRHFRKFKARYPGLANRGRPERLMDELQGETSMEVYMIGELSTYSTKTLKLLASFIDGMEKAGRNFADLNISNIVRASGYRSLDEAEAKIRG